MIDISSNVRQRSQRTSMLFESAQKVLNLRRGLKMADWTGIRYINFFLIFFFTRKYFFFTYLICRCWLGESSDLAPEAMREVEAIQKMSDTNYKMHEYLVDAMQQNRVGGIVIF